MRAYRYQRDSGSIDFGIIFGIIVLTALCAAWFPDVMAYAPSCAWKGLMGIPCPTCGSTRALMHLAKGDLLSAIAFNPLVSACFLAAGLCFLYSLVTLVSGAPRIGILFSEEEKSALRIGAVTMVLMNWMYLILSL